MDSLMINNNDIDDNLGYSYFFYKFLKKNDILSLSIAAVFSGHINELINSFVNNLFIPILNRDADNDGKKDIKKIENLEIKFFNVNFTIGKFLVDILKFVLVTIVIYTIVYKFKLY
jgi:large-conductance mechanosensitive channel